MTNTKYQNITPGKWQLKHRPYNAYFFNYYIIHEYFNKVQDTLRECFSCMDMVPIQTLETTRTLLKLMTTNFLIGFKQYLPIILNQAKS